MRSALIKLRKFKFKYTVYRMGFQDATNTIKTPTLLFFSIYSLKGSMTTILTFTHVISVHF